MSCVDEKVKGEIDESSCVKPSVAKALFLRLEAVERRQAPPDNSAIRPGSEELLQKQGAVRNLTEQFNRFETSQTESRDKPQHSNASRRTRIKQKHCYYESSDADVTEVHSRITWNNVGCDTDTASSECYISSAPSSICSSVCNSWNRQQSVMSADTSQPDPPPPSEFKRQHETMFEWFRNFSDMQKNFVLQKLMTQCGVPQTHVLSTALEQRLHVGCPVNCKDLLSWLPDVVVDKILTYLDPVSLCRAASVCHHWYHVTSRTAIWQRLCQLPGWRMSSYAERRQVLAHLQPNGQVNWKAVFGKRYKIKMNWILGKCTVRTFEGHTQSIFCVQFDDTRIVSGSSDKTIKVWNIRTNSPWTVQTLVGHSGTVRCLHLEGNRLVSGSADNTIKIWDLSTQQGWSSIACKGTLTGHTDTVRCLKVSDSTVVSGSYDRSLKIWDVRSGTCNQTLRGHSAAVLCVQFDDNKLVSGSCDKTIKVWNWSGECLLTLSGHDEAVTCLQFDSTQIVSGSIDSTLKFWALSSGQCVRTIDWKAAEGHTGVVRCLQADSWRVVSASDDRTIKVWDLATGTRIVTLRHHTDGVTCLQFSDSLIVSGSYDKTVKLWDFACV